ncbi:MAG: hypothetical protein R3F17_10610 [Planctomycetota bacterium]
MSSADSKPQEACCSSSPRGFCAGVDRAIEIVRRALGSTARPSTCCTRSCTTPIMLADLRSRGTVFVKSLERCRRVRSPSTRPGVSDSVVAQGRPRPQGDRRHLPAGDQGAPAGVRYCRRPGR